MGEQYSGKPTALFFGTHRRNHNPCPFFQDNYSETPLSGRHTAEDKTPFFNKPGNSKVQGNVAHGGGARCNSPGHIKKPCQFNRRATHIGGGLVGRGAHGIPGGIRGADTGSGKFILLRFHGWVPKPLQAQRKHRASTDAGTLLGHPRSRSFNPTSASSAPNKDVL